MDEILELIEACKNLNFNSGNSSEEGEVRDISYDEAVMLCPTLKGNPLGTYEDKLNFLEWLLETKNTRHGSSLLRLAVENFGNPLTIQFLLNIYNGEGVRRRLRDLRERAGYKTSPIGYYFKEMANTKFKTAFETYSLSNGKFYVNQQVCSVGRFRKVRSRKFFDKLISRDKFNEMKKKIEELKEGFLREEEEKKFPMEITLNNLFCSFEGNAWKSMRKLKMTERQYNAIVRLRRGKDKYFVTKCEYCGGIIQFPLSVKEDDKWEELAHSIYTMCLNEKEGIVLCKKCLKNIWDDEKILDMLKNLGNRNVEFPIEAFCQHFRKDKAIVEGEFVGEKILELFNRIGLKRKVGIQDSKIVILI